MYKTIEDIVFNWLMPFSIMLGLFFYFVRFSYRSYEKLDLDRTWRLMVKIGVGAGLIFTLLYYLNHAEWFFAVKEIMSKLGALLGGLSIVQKVNQMIGGYLETFISFIKSWLPVYTRAFVLTWFFSSLVFLQSLKWRIAFPRAMNIVISTIILFPYLVIQYFFGYDTPFFDYVYSQLFKAKVKENLNDSFFDALQGYDEKGEKFKDGVGGSVQTRRIKSATISVRQTKVSIITSGGTRKAKIVIRVSRETDTDKLIENSTKGLGARLLASSIRFQDDPILNMNSEGYEFDSAVPYNAGDALGRWKDNFYNPFAEENKVYNGGKGFFKTVKQNYYNFFFYVFHITPPAIKSRIVDKSAVKFFVDDTIQKAKYIARQNIDLSIIPEPKDVLTGNTIEEQKTIAKQTAQARLEDVTSALNAYKLNGTFDSIQVGGNTAIYKFVLPKSANLPTDFKKIQEGVANMLKMSNIPIITPVAGTLTVSVVNDVNIPVDFSKMILNREKGMSHILTGIAGIDGMGNNIYVKFTEQIPHILLFGRTGSGKTVTIMSIIYSIMDANTPDDVRVDFIDGKGNSFEFLRTDEDVPKEFYHPNPFVYSQPADGSGDIDFVRAKWIHYQNETVRRIQLFKERAVQNIDEWNEKFPDEKMFRILLVADEISAQTDTDDFLKANEYAILNITDKVEYIAKMSRSVGIHMLLANQTARKEKVKGRITANVGGRVSLAVAEPIESDIALPDSKVPLHYITQAGEFYSTLNGIRNPEHGNTPYLSGDVMKEMNDDLERTFGHNDYVVTREEMISEMNALLGKEESEDEENLENGKVVDISYPMPSPFPTKNTPIDELELIVRNYPVWAMKNKSSVVFQEHMSFMADDVSPNQRKNNKKRIANLLVEIEKAMSVNEDAETRKTAGEKTSTFIKGEDKEAI